MSSSAPRQADAWQASTDAGGSTACAADGASWHCICAEFQRAASASSWPACTCMHMLLSSILHDTVTRALLALQLADPAPASWHTCAVVPSCRCAAHLPQSSTTSMPRHSSGAGCTRTTMAQPPTSWAPPAFLSSWSPAPPTAGRSGRNPPVQPPSRPWLGAPRRSSSTCRCRLAPLVLPALCTEACTC